MAKIDESRDDKAFNLGVKHGAEDKRLGNVHANYSPDDYTDAYLLGYNKGYRQKVTLVIDAT